MCVLLFVGLQTLKKLLEDPLYSKGVFFKQLSSWFCTLNVSAQGKMNLLLKTYSALIFPGKRLKF